MTKKSVLGRGVDALLSGNLESEENSPFFLLDVDKILPNPNQPRKYFDEDKLQILAESIKERGVIQPLLVTKADKGNQYFLIAGERRLRAARLAGREEVPVVVMDDQGATESLELALIENIQRQDLNPIEEASAYLRLIEEFALTQEEVAQKVGRNRSTVTNVLRLLQLPEEIQKDVAGNRLSEGHARVLLRFKDEPQRLQEIRDRIIKEDLSVRETERLCRQLAAKPTKKKEIKERPGELPDSYCQSLTTQLMNHFNTKIRIIQNGGRGKLELEYFSSDDLERLVNLLTH